MIRALAASWMLAACLAAPLRAEPDCSRKELAAGTVLADGTVAGEKEAYLYFKEREPALHAVLKALPPATARARYGNSFTWFQRPAGCRLRQKSHMILRLKAGLRADDLAAELRRADPARRAAAQAKLEEALCQSFDEDITILEKGLLGLEGLLEEREQMLEEFRADLDRRRALRAEIVAARLKELLSRP